MVDFIKHDKNINTLLGPLDHCESSHPAYVSFFSIGQSRRCVVTTVITQCETDHRCIFGFCHWGKNSNTFPHQQRSSWVIKGGKRSFLVETFWHTADMLRLLVLTGLAAVGKDMAAHTALYNHSLLIFSCLIHSLTLYQSVTLSVIQSIAHF